MIVPESHLPPTLAQSILAPYGGRVVSTVNVEAPRDLSSLLERRSLEDMRELVSHATNERIRWRTSAGQVGGVQLSNSRDVFSLLGKARNEIKRLEVDKSSGTLLAAAGKSGKALCEDAQLPVGESMMASSERRMREIRMSGAMSGDWKRSITATAPVLDSTHAEGADGNDQTDPDRRPAALRRAAPAFRAPEVSRSPRHAAPVA